MSNSEIGKGQWVLHIDDWANVQGAGIVIILQSANGLVLEEGIRLGFEVTNNETKYEAFIYDLELACHLNIRNLEV